MEKIKQWKNGLEEKGLRVNMSKTKIMKCRYGVGQVEVTSKHPCGVCRKGIRNNSIYCSSCKKWIHKRCSGVKGRLKPDVNFKCAKCRTGRLVVDEPERTEVAVGSDGELECVEKFCYLGDMIGARGGARDAAITRVRCAWSKFQELSNILTTRDASLSIKGKVYKACVQSVLVYGSETWATKDEDMKRLERTQNWMMRWMCGVQLKSRVKIEEMRRRLEVESVLDVIRRGRLRWFGHVERKNADDWVSGCRGFVVDGARPVGRPKNTWKQVLVKDLKGLGLKAKDAQDRTKWRVAIHGKPSNPS